MSTYTVFVQEQQGADDVSFKEQEISSEFSQYDDAVDVAKALVDASLFSGYRSGMSARQLYQTYLLQGVDPMVVPVRCDAIFSASQYAKQRCAEICARFDLMH